MKILNKSIDLADLLDKEVYKVYKEIGKLAEEDVNAEEDSWYLMLHSAETIINTYQSVSGILKTRLFPICRAWEYTFIICNLLQLSGSIDRKVKWLEVGSGRSLVPFYLSNRGIDVTVVDVDNYALSWIKEKALKSNNNIVTRLVLDNNLDFDSNTFDVINCVFVYAEAFIKYFYKALRILHEI